MRLRINIYTITSAVFSINTLVSFWAFSRLFDETLIFYLGVPFALSTFLFSSVLLRGSNKEWAFKIANGQIPKIFLGALTILSVLTVLLVPAYYGSIFDWANIPLINWLRYLSSIFLTMFLPGYFLLKIFDSQNSISLLATIALSYVLSMFITFITGFGMLLAYNSIFSLASFLLIAVTLALMAICYLRPSLKKHSTIDVSLVELGALLAALLVTIVGNIYVMNSTRPLSGGDMWDHLAQALQYSKGFPIHEGMLIPGGPYLFHICLATFFQLCGLPSPIAYQALFILSFIPALSFYSLIKGWFPKRKSISSVAILLVPLLGFGSLYAISLRVQNNAMILPSILSDAIRKTYDVMDIMIIGPAHSNVVPILFIELPALFMFLYLLRKNMNSIPKLLLFALIVAVSYLGHVSGSFFMALTLLLYEIVMRGEGVKESALGGILGLFVVFLVDISAPARNYVLGIGGVSSSGNITFLVTLLLFSSSYMTSVLVRRFHITCKLIFNSFRKALSLIPWIILYAYLFSLIVWLYILPSYDAIKFGHYVFTPFFIWPIRFGPIGLLLIICLSLYLEEIAKDKRLAFFLALATSGFALEQFANYYPLYLSYRFATLTLIGAIVLVAYGVVKSSALLIRNKRILLTTILVFLMIPGMLSSSLFYFGRAQLKPTINSFELEALSFVAGNLPSNLSVLTITENSAKKLETFGGVNTVQVMQRWSYTFLQAQDVSVILYLFGKSSVKYVYLTRSDWGMLDSSQSVLRDLLEYFPVAFQNENVTIFGVPKTSIPLKSSKLAIINFLEPATLSFEHTIAPSETVLTSIPSFQTLNYSLRWLPLQANLSRVVIDNFENVSQWAVTEGLGVISQDIKDKIGETPALAVYNITTDKSGYFAVGENGNWDFSDVDHLQLWIKVPREMPNIVKIILRGEGGTWLQWFVSDFPLDRWIKLAFPFDNPTGESNPKLSLKEVRHIDIGFATKPSANISFLMIDDLALTNESLFLSSEEIKYSLNDASTIILTHDPNVDLNMLMPWVESGNRLVVLDALQNPASGFFFNFLRLKSEGQIESNEIEFQRKTVSLPTIASTLLTTESPDVNPLFWYRLNGTPTSPFIFSKKIGVGEIFYIALSSTILEPRPEHLSVLQEIFTEIAESTDLDIKGVNPTVNSLPSYSTIEGYFNVNGSIKIVTRNLLNAQPIETGRLEVKIENSSMIFNNVTINRLITYGSSQMTAQNASIKMGADSASAYLSISCLENEKLHPIELSVDEAFLEVINSSETISLHIKEALIVLYASDFSLFVRNPTIEFRGEMYLTSATITYGAPYTALAGAIREGITVKGTATIAIDFSTGNLAVVDNFGYSGSAIKNETWTPFEITWFNLFVSPIFFMFLVLIFIVIFIKLCSNNKIERSNKNSL